MPEPLRIGIASSLAVALALTVFLLSGAMEPVDLLFPGARSSGAALLAADFTDADLPDRYGYDGQEMYILIRRLPDLTTAHDEGVDSFRMRRILQPLLAWPAPPGAPTVLVMALGNVVGIGLAAGSLADLARRHGRRAPVGYAACLALVFPVIISTTEPLAFGLAFLGLALADRNRLLFAVGAFALAGLTRETALVAAVAAGVAVARRRSLAAGLLVAGVPLVPFAAWAVALRVVVPGGGMPSRLLGFFDLAHLDTADLVVGVVVLALMVLAVWGWRDVPALRLTAAGYLVCVTVYVSDSFRWEAFIRLSAIGIALGLAALAPRAPGAADV